MEGGNLKRILPTNADFDKVATLSKMLPSPETFQEALRATILFSKIPVKEIAHKMQISRQLLSRAADLNEKFKFSSRHLLPLMRATNNFELLHYLARETNHVVFQLPNVPSKELEKAYAIGSLLAAHEQVGKTFARLDDYFNGNLKQRQDAARKMFSELSVIVASLVVLRSSLVLSGWEKKETVDEK